MVDHAHTYVPAVVTHQVDSRAAWRAVGAGENIQIAAFPYPQVDLDGVAVTDRERLLSREDLVRIGENTMNAGELGLW